VAGALTPGGWVGRRVVGAGADADADVVADPLIFFMLRVGCFVKLKNWRGPLLFDQIETLIFLMN
jgi:hypothetical protein